MGKLSPHFNSQEFACKCGCGVSKVDPELIEVLEVVRITFRLPVYVTSGYRCPAYNKKVGGAPNSRHLVGEAAHIRVKGISVKEVANFLEAVYPDKYGIGRYPRWTHIDVRDLGTRWRK